MRHEATLSPAQIRRNAERLLAQLPREPRVLVERRLELLAGPDTRPGSAPAAAATAAAEQLLEATAGDLAAAAVLAGISASRLLTALRHPAGATEATYVAISRALRRVELDVIELREPAAAAASTPNP